jgi:hypothetical protein
MFGLKSITVLQSFCPQSVVDGCADPWHPKIDALADKMLDRSYEAVFELEGAAESGNHILIETEFADVLAGSGELVGE